MPVEGPVQVVISDPDHLGYETSSGESGSQLTITLANGQQVQVTAPAPQQVQV